MPALIPFGFRLILDQAGWQPAEPWTQQILQAEDVIDKLSWATAIVQKAPVAAWGKTDPARLCAVRRA